MIVPRSVGVISSGAFIDRTNLRKVVFLDGSRLRSIQSHAFHNSGLEEICTPDGVREILEEAFRGCEFLKTVHLNEGLE